MDRSMCRASLLKSHTFTHMSPINLACPTLTMSSYAVAQVRYLTPFSKLALSPMCLCFLPIKLNLVHLDLGRTKLPYPYYRKLLQQTLCDSGPE